MMRDRFWTCMLLILSASQFESVLTRSTPKTVTSTTTTTTTNNKPRPPRSPRIQTLEDEALSLIRPKSGDYEDHVPLLAKLSAKKDSQDNKTVALKKLVLAIEKQTRLAQKYAVRKDKKLPISGQALEQINNFTNHSCFVNGCECLRHSNTSEYSVKCDGSHLSAFRVPFLDFSAVNSSSNTTIRCLIIMNYNFEQISAGAFNNVSVKKIVFFANDINFVRDKAFDGVQSLSSLEFHANRVGSVDANVLKSVPSSVQIVKFTRNTFNTDTTLSSTPISTSTVRGAKKVANARVENKASARMFVDSLNDLSDVQVLFLNDNNFGCLTCDKDWFSNMTKLVTLNLAHNNLAEFPCNNFTNCKHLLHLVLDHNNLTMLNFKLFTSAAPTLRELRIAHNNVRRFRPMSYNFRTRFRNLTYVDMSHNAIEIGYFDIFMEMPVLEFLDLRSNVINTFEESHWPHLRVLLLSDNRLTDFELRMSQFFHMPRLEYLFLDRNLLTWVPYIEWLESLIGIDVSMQKGRPVFELDPLAFYLRSARNRLSVNVAQRPTFNLTVKALAFCTGRKGVPHITRALVSLNQMRMPPNNNTLCFMTQIYGAQIEEVEYGADGAWYHNVDTPLMCTCGWVNLYARRNITVASCPLTSRSCVEAGLGHVTEEQQCSKIPIYDCGDRTTE